MKKMMIQKNFRTLMKIPQMIISTVIIFSQIINTINYQNITRKKAKTSTIHIETQNKGQEFRIVTPRERKNNMSLRCF